MRISIVSSYYFRQTELTFSILSIRIILCFSCYLFIGWVIISESLMECHVPNHQSGNPLHFWIPKNPIWMASKRIWKDKNSISIFIDCLFISHFKFKCTKVTFPFPFDELIAWIILTNDDNDDDITSCNPIKHQSHEFISTFIVRNVFQLPQFATWNLIQLEEFPEEKKTNMRKSLPKNQTPNTFHFNEWNQYISIRIPIIIE